MEQLTSSIEKRQDPGESVGTPEIPTTAGIDETTLMEARAEHQKAFTAAVERDLAKADEVAEEIKRTGTLSETIPENKEEGRDYLEERKKRKEALYNASYKFSQEQFENDKRDPGSFDMPDVLARDDLANSTIEYVTMKEVDRLYERAKPAFGRPLAPDEEEIFLTTMDYVTKRIINLEIKRTSAKYNERQKQPFFSSARAGLYQLLPGERELFAQHDLVHIVLAIQQGIENDNSPVPTFMQESRKEFNSTEQAMLEEAFASMFQVSESSYDDFLKKRETFQGRNREILDKESGPLYKNKLLTDETYGNQARETLDTFISNIQALLESEDPYQQLILFSQVASIATVLGSDDFEALSPSEQLDHLEEQIALGQQNIRTLLSGEAPEEKDEKYKKTVSFIRESYADATRMLSEAPEKPIFVEILLKTLKPLYSKAKAQAENTVKRLTSKAVSNDTTQ